MSEVAHFRARVGGLVKNRPGDVAAVAAARRDLAAARLRQAMAAERAALGLPPLSERLQVALSAVLVADGEAMAA